MIVIELPSLYYETWIIYDTGKDVALNDYPRLGVVLSYWMELMLTFVGILWEYYSEWMKIDGLRAKVTDLSIDGISIANLMMRENLLLGYHIVGMLSSSYQGNSISERVNLLTDDS